ncbi:MAG: hypothetical protein IPK68_23250 [Bdellovibrionales bacterium]|nr:hypothetical protein [Bdellovibrionales bacterium]
MAPAIITPKGVASRAYSLALFAHVFENPMPAMPDGFDVLTMLEPDFESFDELCRSTFFPFLNESPQELD